MLLKKSPPHARDGFFISQRRVPAAVDDIGGPVTQQVLLDRMQDSIVLVPIRIQSLKMVHPHGWRQDPELVICAHIVVISECIYLVVARRMLPKII